MAVIEGVVVVKPEKQPYYCEQRQSWVVPLTRGYEALIDEENLNLVKGRRWFAKPDRKLCYAIARFDGKLCRMHRIFTNCPPGMEVDHINGNGLDNRMANLKVCTKRENHQNRACHRNGKLVGCSFDTHKGAWKSYIKINKKSKSLGYFETEFEAHERYMEEYEKISGL